MEEETRDEGRTHFVQGWKRHHFFSFFFIEEHLSPQSFVAHWPESYVLCFMLKPVTGKVLKSGPGAISEAHGLGAENK